MGKTTLVTSEENLQYIDEIIDDPALKEAVLEFLVEENLQDTLIDDMYIDKNYLYDSVNIEIDEKEYVIMNKEYEAEHNAREQLDRDPEIRNFWIQDLQANESSNESLEEYKDRIIDFDGWPYVLCIYDEEYYITDNDHVYWRTS